jgi:signal transduction histidine kinase
MQESETFRHFAGLAAGLAHEIKNPLSTISMNLQLLCEDLEGRTELSARENRILKRTRILMEESKRVEDILEKFLLFFRDREPQLRPGNINQLVDGVLKFLEPEIAALGIQLRLRLDYRIPFFHFDFDQIRTAFLNLIKNAESAMPDGGELIVQTYLQGDTVFVEVTDTGVGIPGDRFEKIFEIFYTTGEKGSGLGLPTARKIARMHGGDVSLQSEPGKGSRFSLAIPCRGRRRDGTTGS